MVKVVSVSSALSISILYLASASIRTNALPSSRKHVTSLRQANRNRRPSIKIPLQVSVTRDFVFTPDPPPSSRLGKHELIVEGNKDQSLVEQSTAEGASIPNEVFNLVKSIMGAAIFTLPAGIATFSNSPWGLLPSTMLLVIIGVMSAYCFSLIGRACAYTGASSYKEAWAKSVSAKTSWIPNLSSLMTTLQAIVAYSIVLSDTIPQLLTAVGVTSINRTQALFGVTGCVLLPLCLMKTLSALAPFSLLGICGLLYTAVAMVIRLLDGSYAVGGQFYEQLDAAVRPSFGTTVNLWSPALFLLASRMSNAFMAHYQAPKLYHELRNNTVPRYQRMVATSYSIVFLVYTIIAGTGYLTFGQNSASFVLNNYSTNDPLLSASRFAILCSLIFSYPLTFVGFRDSLLDAFGVTKHSDGVDAVDAAATALVTAPSNKKTISNAMLKVTTVGLLALITICAYFLKDIGALLSFGGATYANWLTFLYPTIMMWHCSKRIPALRKERPALVMTLLAGLGMSLIGTKEFVV